MGPSAALLRVVVAACPRMHRAACWDSGPAFHINARVQRLSLRGRAWFQISDFKRHLAAGVRQGSEVEGEDDADQLSDLPTTLELLGGDFVGEQLSHD